MSDNPDIRQRRSLRLKGYDYSQDGAYFVTICAHGRECLFGEVIGSEMKMNEIGRKVQAVWDDLPIHYPHIATDAFVVMPNHVHGVIAIRAGLKPAPTKRHGLSEIVRAFKTFSARRINEFRKTSALSCGNAIITIMSSATILITIVLPNMLPITRSAGWKIHCIQMP